MRTNLGDEYVDALFHAVGRIACPTEADLCCYWFEKARTQFSEGKRQRAGLLATQGIRGGANREVLKRIKETGDIFFAERDRDWILDGANVHVSMVGFDDGTETTATYLDGNQLSAINANLTSAADITTGEATGRQSQTSRFMGDTKGGAVRHSRSTRHCELLDMRRIRTASRTPT